MSKRFYLGSAVIGAVVPWIFFANFIIAEGLNIPLFIQSLFVNGPAGGFVADVLLSIVVFLIWSFADARRFGVREWWVVLPASFFVGLSFSLPLYLYLRHDYQVHHRS